VSNTALLMGVAGAGASADTVTITGVAGLVAGALSMGAGEFVSVRSQREMYEYQIALEREEVAEYPDEEAEELALIYAARGVPIAEAREFAHALFQRPDDALAVLAREELGLNPDDLASPTGAAVSSFVAFAAGAAVPIVPFLAWGTGQTGIVIAMIASAASLALVGLALSLLTGHSALRGALRMVLIGGGAGAVAFGIGRLLGATLS
jgi:VIT1/CCC1 family predicted Fe2+/Mn2+ transporter